jgi:hypothetical protein
MVPHASDAPASQTQSTRKTHRRDEFHHAGPLGKLEQHR